MSETREIDTEDRLVHPPDHPPHDLLEVTLVSTLDQHHVISEVLLRPVSEEVLRRAVISRTGVKGGPVLSHLVAYQYDLGEVKVAEETRDRGV